MDEELAYEWRCYERGDMPCPEPYKPYHVHHDEPVEDGDDDGAV